MLGDSSPMSFCISAYLVSRGTNGLCSELCSKGYLFSKQPWKIEIVSPSKAEYWLLANIIKIISPTEVKVRQICSQHIILDWASLSWEVSCNAVPLCAQYLPGSLLCCPHGSWRATTTYTNVKLMLFVLYLNKVLCLWPRILVSSANMYEAGKLISLQVGYHSQFLKNHIFFFLNILSSSEDSLEF